MTKNLHLCLYSVYTPIGVLVILCQRRIRVIRVCRPAVRLIVCLWVLIEVALDKKSDDVNDKR